MHRLSYYFRVRDVTRALVIPLFLGAVVALADGCLPVETPTATNAVIAALNTTDRALEAAVLAALTDAEAENLRPYIVKWEAAAAEVKAAKDLCGPLSAVAEIATGIQCAECTRVVALAREQLKCP
jgi:hypothetical protein